MNRMFQSCSSAETTSAESFLRVYEENYWQQDWTEKGDSDCTWGDTGAGFNCLLTADSAKWRKRSSECKATSKQTIWWWWWMCLLWTGGPSKGNNVTQRKLPSVLPVWVQPRSTEPHNQPEVEQNENKRVWAGVWTMVLWMNPAWFSGGRGCLNVGLKQI